MKNKKIAIILFNLGGPDSRKNVKYFLFNLFNDYHIINCRKFFRYILAFFISLIRTKSAQKMYDYIGGKSPLLKETIYQKEALEKVLDNKLSNYKIFICMRYWNPMSKEVVKNVKNYQPNEIILLPLYPQYSFTTSGSSINNFIAALKNYDYFDQLCLKIICCYSTASYFIKAHTSLIKEKMINVKEPYIILFSAHGLPQKIVNNGDPYQWHIEQSTSQIIKEIGIENLNYKVTYQSKIGPLKWLEPDTKEEIKNAAKLGLTILVVPIAFVSEHLETLVELDIEYKKIAEFYGVNYIRIKTLSITNIFIHQLATMILDYVNIDQAIIGSHNLKRICPNSYNKCPCLLLN